MRREEVIEELARKLRELGVPEHARGIKKVPSRVELDILVSSGSKRLDFRSGITRPELAEKLAEIERIWRAGTGPERQIDLEEVLAEAAQ